MPSDVDDPQGPLNASQLAWLKKMGAALNVAVHLAAGPAGNASVNGAGAKKAVLISSSAATSTKRVVPGGGGYVFEQHDDGKIFIIQSPKHGDKRVEVTDPKPYDAILKQIGPFPKSPQQPPAGAVAPIAGQQQKQSTTTNKVTRQGKDQEMAFDVGDGPAIEVPVSRGDPGITSEQQIVNLLQRFRDAIQDYWHNYSLGLKNFTDRMQFASDQEAQPKQLQAVFTALAKETFDESLNHAGSKLGGPWGKTIDGIKSAAEAWVAESERATAAAGQVRIADYIEGINNNIPVQRDRMVKVLDEQRRPLLESFQEVAKNDVGKGKASQQGVVVGESARVLMDLEDLVKSFERSIPKPADFQREFATRFANTPGWTGRISHGARLSGMIYFNTLELRVDPGNGDAWSIKDKSSAWTLVTSSPSPDKIATSLSRSLDGKMPWEIELPKMVKMRIEVEERGLNGYQDGYIYFTKSPDRFEVRSNYGKTWFEKAWLIPNIRNAALKVTALEGSSK
jgi:hypothetical protein